MIVVEYLPPRPDVLWQLARQMGIRHAIVNAKPQRTGLNPPWDIDALRQVQRELDAAALKIQGLEGDQFDMSRIKLGSTGGMRTSSDFAGCCATWENSVFRCFATISWRRLAGFAAMQVWPVAAVRWFHSLTWKKCPPR
jgi:hypothetical protein